MAEKYSLLPLQTGVSIKARFPSSAPTHLFIGVDLATLSLKSRSSLSLKKNLYFIQLITSTKINGKNRIVIYEIYS